MTTFEDFFQERASTRDYFTQVSEERPFGWRNLFTDTGTIVVLAPGDLIATQTWIDLRKVQNFIDIDATDNPQVDRPIVTYERGFWWLLDGHHRSVAAIKTGQYAITCRVFRRRQ